MLYASFFILYVRFWLATGASFKQGVVHTETCETKECHDAADHIKKWMNPAFKPCEDFYEFTCGYWHSPDNKTVNKKHNASMGSRGDFFSDNLKTFLLDDTVDKESNLFHMMKQFMNMCLDQESIEARGVSPAVTFLREAGGWPVLEEHWSEENWNLLDTDIAVGGVFFKIEIYLGSNDTWSLYIIPKFLFEESLSKYFDGPQNVFVENDFIEKCDLAETFGANRSKAELEMREALEFEIATFKIIYSMNNTEDFQVVYNMSQLQSDISWINWTRLLTPLLPEDVNLAPNETVMVVFPSLVKKLGTVIDKYPKRTVANFMMYKAASSLKDYLPNKLFNITSESPDQRFKTCVKTLKKSSFMGVLASYIARQTVEETRVAKEMTQHILDELLIDLKQLEWLDDETRSVAIKKLQETNIQISYPDELLNLDTVEEIYKEVKINTSYFFEAAMDIEHLKRQEMFRKLGKNSSDMSLRDQIAVEISRGAYFRFGENKIAITAGFLHRLPLFSSKVPAYVSYGQLGHVVAHELTHALDIQTNVPVSRKDERQLQYLLNRWESNTTMDMYNDKKQCIINQYSSFNDSKNTGKMLNGNQTKKEDIADNGGLKLAFRAYKRMAAQLTTPEPKLPGLQQYSHEQLFLISLANTFCEIPVKEKILYKLTYDSHSPFEFRVKGMMMNLPDFSKLFNCNEGDPMNPQKKCEVWYLVYN